MPFSKEEFYLGDSDEEKSDKSGSESDKSDKDSDSDKSDSDKSDKDESDDDDDKSDKEESDEENSKKKSIKKSVVTNVNSRALNNNNEVESEESTDSDSDSDSYIRGYRISKTTHLVKATHWTYEGCHGPLHWHELLPRYAIAKSGKQQSPIDVVNAKESTGCDVHYNYQSTPIKVLNNGHTIQVDYAPGSTLTVDGKEYELKQFHFHTPSEHTINGQHCDMEMHLVHSCNETKELAVVGVFINIGQTNEVISDVWNNLPPKMKKSRHHGDPPVINVPANINANDLLPESKTLYRYSGSLTTPPCSEGVSWFLCKEPIEFGLEQVQKFKDMFVFNNRPTQDIFERDIWIADELLG